jgi:hypothetical protein
VPPVAGALNGVLVTVTVQVCGGGASCEITTVIGPAVIEPTLAAPVPFDDTKKLNEPFPDELVAEVT